MKPLPLLLLLANFAWAQTDPFSAPLSRNSMEGLRTWTSTVGTEVEARYISSSADKVKLEKADGTVIEVSLAALSAADREFLGKPAPKPEPPKPAKPAPPSKAEVPPLPENFPKDETIDIIPVLKKKKTQPINFSFLDSVSSKTITATQLRGKYVYVHTLYFYNLNGRQLQDLKLLHEKYAARGFEILSIHPFAYNNRQVESRFTMKAARENVRKAIEDYGITWMISFPNEEGKNPLLEKISDQDDVNWLLDPEGKLLHTNITSGGGTSSSNVGRTDFLPLARALKLIFGN